MIGRQPRSTRPDPRFPSRAPFRSSARERARQRPADPVAPLLIGELENLLATAEIAVDDMIRLANGFDFTPTTELASKVLVRKAIAAKAVIAAVEKALE